MGAQFPITPAGATSPFDLKLRPGDHPEIVALMRTIARQPRRRLEAAVEMLLQVLDLIDGDADLEPDGDERDSNGAEDDFMNHSLWAAGPGCAVSDPDMCDAREDGGTHNGGVRWAN